MKYQHSFTEKAPLSTVAAFHSDTRALRDLTPPPMTVKSNNVESLTEGSMKDPWLISN
jgi:ligand-binding SRPBCC domain-containing protein